MAEGFDTYLRLVPPRTARSRKAAGRSQDVGKEAPLVSEYTLNLGAQKRWAFGRFGASPAYSPRADVQRIGANLLVSRQFH